ncbi:MAG: alpha/beta hydrolase [Actinomycetota bacterium]|nr:alpha/beta hydrolase [Actinomycetota bacterium]
MKTFRTSGGDVAYREEREGPPVVLLHGFPTSSVLWRAIVPALSARMRVITVDLLGFGRSEKPAEAPLHIRAQAGYVRELLQGNGIEEFAVAGHDIGGGVAQLLALEGGVRALVLVDSVAFDTWPIEGVRLIQDASPDQETPEFVRDVLGVALDLGLARPDALPGDVREAYVAPFDGVEGARAFFRAARAIDGQGLAGREAELARLDVPALLVWGEDDPYIPVEMADRLADTLAHATEVLLPGCSHFLPEDAPETLADLMSEFLRARYLGLSHGHEHAAGPVPLELHRRGPA